MLMKTTQRIIYPQRNANPLILLANLRRFAPAWPGSSRAA